MAQSWIFGLVPSRLIWASASGILRYVLPTSRRSTASSCGWPLPPPPAAPVSACDVAGGTPSLDVRADIKAALCAPNWRRRRHQDVRPSQGLGNGRIHVLPAAPPP
eukprot:5820302-Prymnesium_polylepis.1